MIQLAVEMTVVVNDHRLRLGVDPRKTEKLQGSYLGGVLVVQVKVWPHRLCLTSVPTAGLHLVTYRKGTRPVRNSRIGDGAVYKESPCRFVLPGKYAKLGVYDHTVTTSVQCCLNVAGVSISDFRLPFSISQTAVLRSSKSFDSDRGNRVAVRLWSYTQ